MRCSTPSGTSLSKRIWYDKPFVAGRSEGFEEYRKIVEGYTPESVEAITGISAGQIRECARLYATPETP